MSTVIFDFDSTLIRVESLEEILAPKLKANPELDQRIREITALGMEGAIGFQESLERRLAIAAPTLAEVHAFGAAGAHLITPGIPALIHDLLARGVDVRVVSGGLREAIIPVVAPLGVAAERVHAVALRWSEHGDFLGVDPADRFSLSKVEGVKPLAPHWSGPKIAIGDGMTDYHLKRDGLADHFIAFTGHVRREPVVATGAPQAADVETLRHLIWSILD